MLIETPQPLPENVSMLCYACEQQPATHVCRFKVGALSVQVCLCPQCMKMDTQRLLKNTIGIQGISEKPDHPYLMENKSLPRSRIA